MKTQNILAAIAFALLTGCGGGDPIPVAPVLDHAQERGPAECGSATILAARAYVHDGAIRIDAAVRSSQPYLFQVFLNTDEDVETGYTGQGFEYVARGPGVEPGGPVIRTTVFTPTNPGGWGHATGPFQALQRNVTLRARLPLAALGNDDGSALLRLELYSTNGEFLAFEDLATGGAYIHVSRQPTGLARVQP